MEFRNYMERFRWVRLWQNRIVASFHQSQFATFALKNKLLGASLEAQRLKRLPPMWETRVRSLGWEDPLEKEMAPHSNILAWRIPWAEEPVGLQSMGSQRVRHDSTFTFTIAILTNSFIGITENYTNVGAYIQAHLCVFQWANLVFLFVLHVNIDEYTPSLQCNVLQKKERSILKFITSLTKNVTQWGKNFSFYRF